ncbi:MAG: phosphoglycerate kinase [Candidatus Liptonbacteria bacterium]|nr:phosphoglycerate kinase [Candidatus Liptonbacteria bacterium]
MIRYLSTAPAEKISGIALLRLDFNTEDDWRLEATLPTVKLLTRHARAVVILSHRGRPPGPDPRLSLVSDAKNLGKLLKHKVVFIPHFRFADIRSEIKCSPPGSVFLLENLRFHPDLRFAMSRQGSNDGVARHLASLGDYYVNDAFAVSHRADASLVEITRFLPSYAGLEMEKEIKFLRAIVHRPKRPLVVILGGAKARDKLAVIQRLRRQADWFLLGGASANTMLMLQGVDVRKSLLEMDPKVLAELRRVLHYRNVIVPIDYRFDAAKHEILDIGPRAVQRFKEKIKIARTILWSGPMGKWEEPMFRRGTLAVAQAVTANRRALTVAGGGETVTFLRKHKLDQCFDFISTGGGALMDYLAGEKLPGIEALKKK